MEIKEYQKYCEDEILRLYASVGWAAYTEQPEALRRGFDRSLLTLAAYEGAELLGLIRVVGDGQTIVFVQDLLVFPKYQRKGVGSALLRAVLKRYENVRQIELAAAQKGEHIAMLEARRHVNCYLKQQSGLKTFKNRICALERLEQLYEIVEELKQTVSEE